MQRYSKRHIIEAIRYWDNVLRQLDESKSLLIDALVDTFSPKVVFSRKPFMLTDRSAL